LEETTLETRQDGGQYYSAFKETDCENLAWTGMAQYGVQWRVTIDIFSLK